MNVPVLALSFVLTIFGGWAALRFQRLGFRSHVISFAAGTLIAVALVDLLPAALAGSTSGTTWVFVAALAGFLVFDCAQRYLYVHVCNVEVETGHSGHAHTFASPWIGVLSMCTHSLIDGVLLGVASLAPPAVTAVVVLGILTHRFCDGVNIVAVHTSCGRESEFPALIANALAPVVGFALSGLWNPPRDMVPLLLALFAGFFLCLGATDLLPRSRQGSPAAWPAAWVGALIVTFIVLSIPQ